jgi:hypothetical protein
MHGMLLQHEIAGCYVYVLMIIMSVGVRCKGRLCAAKHAAAIVHGFCC